MGTRKLGLENLPSPLELAPCLSESRSNLSSSRRVTMRDPKAIEPKDLKARPRDFKVGFLGYIVEQREYNSSDLISKN